MMEPFSPELYPDGSANGRPVVHYRVTYATSAGGASKRTYAGGVRTREEAVGEPIAYADVVGPKSGRKEPDGDVSLDVRWTIWTPADIAAAANDEFTYLGRLLVADTPTTPDGMGPVTWKTMCVEVTS